MYQALVMVAALALADDTATGSSAAAASVAKTKATTASFAMHSIETKILNETNEERARHGLPALEMDTRLMTTARNHCAWMTRGRRLQHTSLPVAENIAMGQRSAVEALDSWMSSSGHRANILNRGHRKIGVAAYRTPDGTIYWCQQFTH